MLLAARKPLDDARWALRRLDETDDATEFRVLWAATASLLRTVGQVLDKVDAAQNPKLRPIVDEWWSRVKRERHLHPLFWEFIDEERNRILKEYRMGYVEGDVMLAVDGETYKLTSPVYKPLRTEAFNAEDARDIAADSLAWWEAQLAEIENVVGRI